MFKIFHSDYLSKSEQKCLLEFARQAIAAKLNRVAPARIPTVSSRMQEPRGAFVTLTKEQNLRGCIGFVTANKPLYETIQEMAQAAAFSDPRFPPLKAEELSETRIEISILSPMQKLESIKKMKIARHGVFVRHGDAKGLLLPQVAAHNHWDREVFLEQACLKAGLEKDDWKRPETEVMIFDAQVFEEKTFESQS